MQRSLFKEAKRLSSVDERAEQIYGLYPRKENKQAAITAIRHALEKEDYQNLFDSTRLFRDLVHAAQEPRQFVPLASTWFNGERWKDDDTRLRERAARIEAEQAWQILQRFIVFFGAMGTAEQIKDLDKRRRFKVAKRVLKKCGSWQSFCDGKVTFTQFLSAWREG